MKKVLAITSLCICMSLVGCSKTNDLKGQDVSATQEVDQNAELKANSSNTDEDSSAIINDIEEKIDKENLEVNTEENNEDEAENKQKETKEIISAENSVNEDYYKKIDNMTEDEFIAKVQERNTFQENCSFYNEIISYRERVLLTTDVSVVINPIFETDKKYYSKEDFKDCSKNVLLVVRNEIYARYGRIFKNEDLNNYFKAQLWYEPRFKEEEFNASILNDYEIKNIETIIAVEKDLG